MVDFFGNSLETYVKLDIKATVITNLKSSFTTLLLTSERNLTVVGALYTDQSPTPQIRRFRTEKSLTQKLIY